VLDSVILSRSQLNPDFDEHEFASPRSHVISQVSRDVDRPFCKSDEERVSIALRAD